MSHPLRVLHVVPSFYPAHYWGGPIASVHQLCNHIAALPGIELKVLTTDAAGPLPSDRLRVSGLDRSAYPGYEVTFCRRIAGHSLAPAVLAKIGEISRWADVLHVTAVYSSTTIPSLLAARLRGKPVVWSTRGALQRWPGTRRLWAKALWERACRALIDTSRTAMHVTSVEERDSSARRFPGMHWEVVPNGVIVPAQSSGRDWLPGGLMRLGFLGRIDPIKGIENLVEALSALERGRCSLDIYGTGEPSYVHSLEVLAERLGVHRQVSFRGVVEGESKTRALESMDVLVLPSHTENFAMAVAEALAHGTPVIASKGTPWKDIEVRRAGRWVANDATTLAKAISEMRGEDLASMGQRGRDWMIASYSWRESAEKMASLYRRLYERQRSG